MSEAYKPKKRHTSTPGGMMRAAVVPPMDQADQEVLDSLRENRPLDLDKAFPEPPPAVDAEVIESIIEFDDIGRPIQREEPVQPVASPQSGGEVMRRPSRVRLGQPDTPPPLPDVNDAPARRIATVGQHSNSYLTEFRLKVLHRLLMRNLPLDVIAGQLQCSTDTVRQLRNELQKRLIHEAQTINRYEIAGKTLAFYDEIQGMALRMADTPEAKPYTKLQALQTALSAQADRQRFLTASGFWGSAPFTPKDIVEDDSSRAAGKIHQLIEMVMDDSGTMVVDEETMAETARQAEQDDKMDLI